MERVTKQAKTEVEQLAEFVASAEYESISAAALEQLKIRVLDTIGVAIAAQDAEPITAIRSLTERLGGNARATMIGGGKSSEDRVAFYNTALSRYLDFMDSYLAPGETNHPSDNIGAVLAAAEVANASGRDFLLGVALAYQIHTRLSDAAPVRAKGFDHTVQGVYAVAGATARLLELDATAIANAIAIGGTANNALRVTRTGDLSHWKGLAYPQVAKEGMHAALLASAGITGPKKVFEGNKGFKHTISGDFTIDWFAEDLESVTRTIVKKHNAEIHSQSTIDAALAIRNHADFDPTAIAGVTVRTFQVAYDIIGGGEEGAKQSITTKEEADHSLPYLVAAALLDGEVTPAQYEADRIAADDIQKLLSEVDVMPDADFTAAFPAEIPSSVEVVLTGGTTISETARTYRGFVTDPLDFASATDKFTRLAVPFAGAELAGRIADVVHALDDHPISDLTDLLAEVGSTQQP